MSLIILVQFILKVLFPNVLPSVDNRKRLSLLNTCPSREIVYIIKRWSGLKMSLVEVDENRFRLLVMYVYNIDFFVL